MTAAQSVQVFGIPKDPETIRWIWDQGFGSGIQAALKYDSTQDIKKVLQDLLEGLLVGWVAIRNNQVMAVLTTYIAAEENGDVKAVIKHCAGIDMDSWLEFYPLVEEWAKEHGATKIQVHGRAGWARVLDKFGFQPKYVTLEKEV